MQFIRRHLYRDFIDHKQNKLTIIENAQGDYLDGHLSDILEMNPTWGKSADIWTICSFSKYLQRTYNAPHTTLMSGNALMSKADLALAISRELPGEQNTDK